MIYFDHAASSYPKPKSVGAAMLEAVNEYSANPGRGGHQLAEKASEVISEAREKIATLFGAPSKKHVWFYQNATMALNQAIIGFPFNEGDHVITSTYEHNSVLRPLEQLRRNRQIDITYIDPGEDGVITVEEVKEKLNANTKMIVLSHASNVTGAFISLKPVAEVAKKAGAILVVDASQTAGTLPIHMEEIGIDLLAFAGHKSLLGPQGTGVLISRSDYQLAPLVHGGTGSYSEIMEQPQKWPDRYEAGTLNTPGIAGLLAGIDEINRIGLEQIYLHEQKLMEQFIAGLNEIKSIIYYGPTNLSKRVAVIPFRMAEIESHELAMILDEHYNIAVRAGLHCSPKTHHYLNTVDVGLVRVSFGPYNTSAEVEKLLHALQEIAQAFN
ncbi:aminotransferase class V-fold PLP-dependent enzyme [Halalkalibacter urbisdiaboli]|uniref:aminotransferase class V-fold PLP-dependent enzyme n=1 Tax=Halalkalibacter urbisdiaboli TaxID=1960589 RepID=UPI000B433511|nr:aminotransferase class V-fold PLP-dependent enzyme [Halalkalibacter urbisdiaboli]